MCNNYIKRVQKVLQIDGARLEKEHLNELNEKKNKRKKYLEYLDDIYEEKHKWELRKKYKIINIYNDKELLKKKKKKIAEIKKYLKRISPSFTDRIKSIFYPKKRGFATIKKNQKKKLTELKNKTKEEITKLKEDLEKMDLLNFLNK